MGISNSTAWSAGLSFNQIFPKPILWQIQPGYSIGATYWTNNDELYYFENLSFPLNVILSYPISSSISVLAENGFILTYVMTSDRKQNVTAGFPKRSNYNFSLKFVYKFNQHEDK